MHSQDWIFQNYISKAIVLAHLCILGCLVTVTTVSADEDGPQPLVATYGSLESVLAGGVGEAFLLYYFSERDTGQPSLVVHLEKTDGTGDSTAEVFDAPPGKSYVPVELVESRPALPESLEPAIRITARDGWWVRDGVTNYNLDITVYGPVAAMWGATPDIKGGPQYNWPSLLGPGDLNAQIIVRDVNSDGFPDWDWRTMLPEFPNRGDLRTNYAERKCASPVAIDPGASPQWPFVALGGSFEQPTGIFRPPIVVDWETGRIQYFSELVTVRHQNCSYSIYSIERILPGTMNSPNFETPFAFYDLSGNGVGYPNLILRTGRTILQTDASGLALEQMEVIRYSWSNKDVGDVTMDYKVELFGFHPYGFETPIADGLALIDAPPYEIYPEWVIEKSWPVTTFVDAEQVNYRTSEGIYEWAPGDLGTDFYLGYADQGNIEEFADIRIGLRGEYRMNSDKRSELYLSPIDNRLHLKWAEHGMWRLDDEQVIRVENLADDEFIDVWSREVMTVTVEEDARTSVVSDTELAVGQSVDVEPAERESAEPEVIEALYALDGNLLHSGDDHVILVVADYEPALFETLPPTDHETWEAHRALLAPYEIQRRDPTDLRGWLDAFPGPRSEVKGASLTNLRITDDGFRFELALEADYRATGNDPLGVAGLAPGEYVVEYRNDAFTIAPLTPPALSLQVKQLSEDVAALPLQVVVTNNGVGDASDLVLVAEGVDRDGAVTELTREPVDALAGQTARVLLAMPNSRHISRLTIRLEDAEGGVMITTVTTGLEGQEEIGADAIYDLAQVLVLMPVLGGFAVLIAIAAVLAVRERREGSAV